MSHSAANRSCRWRLGLAALVLVGLPVFCAGCGADNAPMPVSSASRTDSGQAKPTPAAQAPESGQSDVEAHENLRGAAPGEPAPIRPQPRYRPSDDRPVHDDEQLLAVGIRRYESRRLRLYTDLVSELAEPLPALMDAVYDAWEAYFGPLPPDREGADFQMTGYLLVAPAPFRESGLLPEDLPPFPHGRNRGRRFWMNDQPTDYYRRHLLLHEGTHCFMTAISNPLRNYVWYMEGMAELFGTHRFDAQGKPRFGVLPHDREQFANLGRIRLIEDRRREGTVLDVSEIMELPGNAFLKNDAYAWSWALCHFLNNHPRYRERFREVARRVTDGDSAPKWAELYSADRAALAEEWRLFAANLCHGYDLERTALDLSAGRPLSALATHSVEVAADEGWQNSGVEVESGESYRITAGGRFVVAHAPGAPTVSPQSLDGSPLNRPWESEPQGISFRYCGGQPLGKLLATIRTIPEAGESPRTTMLEVHPIGREARFVAPHTGTLYLRINDFWNELADNAGAARVEVRAAE